MINNEDVKKALKICDVEYDDGTFSVMYNCFIEKDNDFDEAVKFYKKLLNWNI